MISLSSILKSNGEIGTMNERRIGIQEILGAPGQNDSDELQEDHQPTKAQIEQEMAKQARHEAEELLKEAQRKWEETEQAIREQKKKFEEERLLLQKRAEEEGYAAGFTRGKKEGYQQVEQEIEKARQIKEKAERDYECALQEAEQEIVHLAVAVAEKIIGRQLLEDHETFLSMVKKAIREVRESETIHIFISYRTYEQFAEAIENACQSVSPSARIRVFPEMNEEEGMCRIETDSGHLEASISSQLDEIETKLLTLLAEGRGHENDGKAHQSA